MEKGGLTESLKLAEVGPGQQVAWADEMRLGLLGQLRGVWGVRGIKIRQHLEQVYNWSYLALAVDGVMGKLWWQWIPNMKKASIQVVVETWRKEGVTALVWDRAPSHRAQVVRAVGLPLIEQPAYCPELNPAERVFEELRRAVEGRVYGSIDKKIAAVESALKDLAATPERVQSLAGWSWIHHSLNQLPQSFTAFS